MFYDISSKYERDIENSLNDERSLVLLGCRADADIKHLNNKIKQLKNECKKWKDEALRQYPTQEAYDAACNALNKHKADKEEVSKKYKEIIRACNGYFQGKSAVRFMPMESKEYTERTAQQYKDEIFRIMYNEVKEQ